VSRIVAHDVDSQRLPTPNYSLAFAQQSLVRSMHTSATLLASLPCRCAPLSLSFGRSCGSGVRRPGRALQIAAYSLSRVVHVGEATSPAMAGNAASAFPASPNSAPPEPDGERILLLECRLEQARSALDEARADADRVRARLADVAAREADLVRRYSLAHQELAEARAEVASLHERLGRSEGLRAELEGHFFEGGARDDAGELLRLRREVLAQRDRCVNSERAAARLRTRVDDLLQSREVLLSRVATWQRLVRQDGPDAIDLAEFMAELRRDILDLEHQTAAGERREAELRKRLVRAGVDPGVDPVASQNGAPARHFAAAPWAEPESAPPAHDSVPMFDWPTMVEPDAELVLGDTDLADAGDVAAEPDFGPAECAAGVVAEPDLELAAEPVADHAAGVAAGPDLRHAERAADVADGPDLGPAEHAADVAAKPDLGSAERAADVADEPDVAPAAHAADVAAEPDLGLADHAADVAAEPDLGPADHAADVAVEPDLGPAASAALAESGEPDSERAAEPAAEPDPERVVGPQPSELITADPDARAAAYGRMVALLEGEPARLVEHLRAGLSDPHPRVRRRTVLAAATAKSVALHQLLDPLRGDPDPQVRRVVREVLRHAIAVRS